MYLFLLLIKLAKRALEICRTYKKKIDRLLPMLGEGTLERWSSSGVKRHYCNITRDGKRTRISIDPACEGSNKLIENLTNKAILKKADKIVTEDIIALERFLKHFKICDPVSLRRTLSQAYDSDDVDISKSFMSIDIDPNAWRHASYEKNTAFGENLKHHTSTHEKVRSKSEAMIYEALIDRDVDFRYECKLVLESKNSCGQIVSRRTVFPDFTILRTSDRRELIYEHFGRMDDPTYMRKALTKIDDYIKAGYYPGINFIMTWETTDQPFTSANAAEVLDYYLGKKVK